MREHTTLIHVGTHKTGTTSLQIFFEANREPLAQAGIAVAQAGRFGSLPGNHRIAWDLLDRPRSTWLDELEREIATSTSGVSVVSSEDLCLLYTQPESLRALFEAVVRAGSRPVILAYFRAQAPYAESLYVERVKHRYIRPVEWYIDTILTTGAYVPDATRISLEFSYARLIEPFVAAFGRENVVLRPYDANADTLWIYKDVLAVLGALYPTMAQTALSLSVPAQRANEPVTFGALLDAVAAEGGSVPTTTDAGELRERYRLFTRAESSALATRFEPENIALAQRYDLHLARATAGDVAPADAAQWLHARVQRPIFDAAVASLPFIEQRRPNPPVV